MGPARRDLSSINLLSGQSRLRQRGLLPTGTEGKRSFGALKRRGFPHVDGASTHSMSVTQQRIQVRDACLTAL